jgi:transcriptional regulator with XRE-family HTH domain
MMERSSKLEAARRHRGWTLVVASQKIGVHPRTLRRWETGKSKPHGFRVYKISEVYETTPTALGISSDHATAFYPHTTMLSAEQNLVLAHIAEPLISIEDLDLHLMGLVLQRKLDRKNLDYRSFQQQLDQSIQAYDDYMRAQPGDRPVDPARQQALRVVASIPIAVYLENITPQTLPAPAEDILTHCASAITACWHMGQEEELVLTRSFVSGYLMLLSEIFTRIPHCQQAAAELIAQACLLRTMLAHRLQEPHTGINYYARALEFSQIADSTTPALAFPTRRNALTGYGKQPEQALHKMAEAIWLLKPAPPPPDFSLIHAYLQNRSDPSLPHLLSGGREEFDELLFEESDFASFPSTLDYARAALHLWHSVIYHELDTYAQKLDDLQPLSAEAAVHDAPEQVRMEFLPNRALAALRLHDMDQAVSTLRATLPQALSLGGEHELLGAREAYHLMQFILPGEIGTSGTKLKDLLKKHD